MLANLKKYLKLLNKIFIFIIQNKIKFLCL